MKPGPLEIILIIVVIIVVAIIARIVRGGRIAREASSSRDTPAATGKATTGKIWSYLNRTGIAMVIVGFIALVTAVSFFRWVLQSYLWGVVVIALGFLLVFLSRKKR
jgi:hypothetical protein